MPSAIRKSKLIRVLPVAFGMPEPWMCSWLNKQQLPGPALIWWACLPHTSVISCILSRFSMAYLVSSRDFLIGMICIERVLSSSAVTSTNGIHRLREAMPWP